MNILTALPLPARLALRTAGIAALAFAGAAQAQLATNLIVNAGAEAAAGGNGNFVANLPGWTVAGELTAVTYTTGNGYPVAADPGPASRGSNFFAGGNVASSSASQRIDLSFASALIGAGNARYDLSGWLGGYLTQADNATLTVTFLNAANAVVGSASLAPVTPADRGNLTGTFLRSTGSLVPLTAQWADVQLLMTRAGGTSNDGYADNLSLVLSAVPEPAPLLLLGMGGALLALLRRRAG